MSNKDLKEKLLVEIDQLFDATENALNEFQGKGNLQFPALLTSMAVKFNWDEKTMRENDPYVRKYVRNHPNWYVTRGAYGGIMKRSEKDKKDADRLAAATAKKQVQEAVDAKVAAALSKTEPASE